MTDVARLHIRFGWALVLASAMVGLVLESLVGFRAPWYVDFDHQVRRHLLTLGHAHGVLLGLVHVVFGLTRASRAEDEDVTDRPTSGLLVAGGVLIPAGFWVGGAFAGEHDPGLGILAVPVGGVALVLGLWRVLKTS